MNGRRVEMEKFLVPEGDQGRRYEVAIRALAHAAELDAKGGPRQKDKARKEREMARLWIMALDNEALANEIHPSHLEGVGR